MRTYHTRGYYSEQVEAEIIGLHHAYTVFEPERRTRETGLLDKDGKKILVTEGIDPIGFVLHGK